MIRPGARWTRHAAAPLLLVALAFGGCGQEGDSPEPSGAKGPGSGGEMLAAADVERVVRAQRQIAACREGQDTRGVDGAVTRLIAIYRAGPAEIFVFGGGTEVGRPMSEVLEEVRSGLETCGQVEAVARVDRALESTD